ncbi:MAG: nicotinate-nucleotide adenylyltransferase [Lautropia sp.]|nr:nicotinate-nucleotide adenylyltransferase [Lautropia sp.]
MPPSPSRKTPGKPRTRIGLLGGSFDPVHVGHLALGHAAVVALQLDELVLIPAGRAWQKMAGQQADGERRLAMLKRAVAPFVATAFAEAPKPSSPDRTSDHGGSDVAEGNADTSDLDISTNAPNTSLEPSAMSTRAAYVAPPAAAPSPGAARWRIDDLEIRRDGPSYTLDTLIELRQRYGEQAALVLIIGSDQFRNLASWHRWTELLDYTHLAVTQRERVPLDDLPAPIEAMLAEHGTDALPDRPAGSIVLFRMPAVPVSSTLLRRHLEAGLPVDGLLPAGVEAYIRQHRLYRSGAPSPSAPTA